jgi:DUF4097 and DUF4098 domain-containing protein YvlB
MKRVAAFALAVFAAGCAIPLRAEVRDEFHRTFPVSASPHVNVKNVNGSVRVAVWNWNEVKVDAVKRGRTRESLDRAQIIADAVNGGLEIRTKYPEHSHNNASVDYTITVPRSAELDGVGTVNGTVTIEGATGSVRASTVNGDVQVLRGEGNADLRTTNGRVEADFARVATSITAKTVNGGIAISLPASAGARLTAKTVHGSVHSDFDLPVRHLGFGPGTDVQAVIGGGGADVRLSTVNGGIDLRRR